MDAETELEHALADLHRRQERMADLQRELVSLELTGHADRGAVSVTITGDGRFTAVDFDPAMLPRYDAYELGQVVLAAIQDTVDKLGERTRELFADVVPDSPDADDATAPWPQAHPHDGHR